MDSGKYNKHLQYGGRFPEEDRFKDYHYCLDYELEPPRIPGKPMDFILLMDQMMNDFDMGIKWGTDWISLVKKSEDILSKIN